MKGETKEKIKKTSKKAGKKISKSAQKVGNKSVKIRTVVVTFLILIVIGVFAVPMLSKKSVEPSIVSVASLEKVVKTSKLSTYQTVFNGIAVKQNEKNPEQVDYYVRYEATVKASLDFDKIKLENDEENKIIYVTLPELELQEPIVKIETLDLIVENDKIDRKTIIDPAYKLAEADVSEESKNQTAIMVYAKKNAENLITGLLKPFVNQYDESYTIQFK